MLDHELIRSLFDKRSPGTRPLGGALPATRPAVGGDSHALRSESQLDSCIHGGVYVASIGKNLAHHSQGVYFIRIEDTDQAREIPKPASSSRASIQVLSPIESDENDETLNGTRMSSRNGAASTRPMPVTFCFKAMRTSASALVRRVDGSRGAATGREGNLRLLRCVGPMPESLKTAEVREKLDGRSAIRGAD
jgi:hypothetical protein